MPDRLLYLVGTDPASTASAAEVAARAGWRLQQCADRSEFRRRACEDCPRSEPCRHAGDVRLALIDLDPDGPPTADLLRELDDLRCPVVMAVLASQARFSEALTVARTGAPDVFAKPLVRDELLRALDQAEGRTATRTRHRALESARERLTPREAHVYRHLLRGQSPKKLAHELGISAKTAHVHRANILRKFGVDSVAALLAMHLRMLESFESEARLSDDRSVDERTGRALQDRGAARRSRPPGQR